MKYAQMIGASAVTFALAGMGSVSVAASIPDNPVTGEIHGKAFKADRVELDHRILELRQGTNFWPEAAVRIFLSTREGESLEGRTFTVNAKDAGRSSVQVYLEWSKNGEDMPTTEMFLKDFTLQLEFGRRKDFKMPGKISLTLPDRMKSHLMGAFVVGPSDDESTEGAQIGGTVSIKGGYKALPAALGCGGKKLTIEVSTIGKAPDGSIDAPGISLTLDGTLGGTATCTSWKPRNSSLSVDNDGTIRHRHVNRPPGTYLLLMQGFVVTQRKDDSYAPTEMEGCFDWKWIRVQDSKAKIPLDLTVDPAALGTLEIVVPESSGISSATCLPLDDKGTIPLTGDLARVQSSSARKVENGKVTFRWLREGQYRVFPVAAGEGPVADFPKSVDVVVRRATVVRSELKKSPADRTPAKSSVTAKTYADETKGFTGLNPVHDAYTFQVDGVGNTATFRFWGGGDIGTDTFGQIVMTGPDGKNHTIFKWSPKTFKAAIGNADSYKTLTPLDCDISTLVNQPGPYTFRFKWTSGTVGLSILRVELTVQ